MKARFIVSCLLFALPAFSADTIATSGHLADAALTSETGWDVLEHLTDSIGPRLTGSKGADQAVQWTAEQLRAWGLFVKLEPVKVPHWVRGAEEVRIVSSGGDRPIAVTTLGGSIATPESGVVADVLEVASIDELKLLGDAARGKIVLFNGAMDAQLVAQGRSFEAYGGAVGPRGRGASAAAAQGAVAALVRSVTTRSLRTPHTGGMRYADNVPKIPAAAIATEDADLIHRLLARGERVRLFVRLTPQTLPDADSFNVIAEIPGSERPEEIVVVGGHLDSWDLGTGAIDNGAGVAITMETMRLIHQMGLRPRRTIRAVLFMNEENGLKGAKKYAEDHFDELWRHVAAVEHDAGVGAPMLVRTTLSLDQIGLIEPWLKELSRLGVTLVSSEDTGADTSPMTDQCVPGYGMAPENTHYFDYHHTAADTLDKIDPEMLRRNTAAFAVLTWVLADMPEALR